jgi:hypothetical protein
VSAKRKKESKKDRKKRCKRNSESFNGKNKKFSLNNPWPTSWEEAEQMGILK